LSGSCNAAHVAVVERVPRTVEAVHLLDGLLPAHTVDQHTIGGRDYAGAVDSGPAADEDGLRRMLNDRQNLRDMVIEMPVRQDLRGGEIPHTKVGHRM